ncbi:MAG: hydroxyacid dehydrogenase [Proteobacteria bacterium]|nr:MAG: hydroxyacid dehydrogenase [Pseudomonadota bacterium]
MKGAILLSSWVTDRYGDALAAAAPDAARVVIRDGAVLGDPAACEVAYFSGDFFPERVREFILALRDAPDVRWVHTFNAGVDNPFFAKLRERGIRLTTSSGAHAVPIAQTVAWYLLSLARPAEKWRDAQQRKAWERHTVGELEGRTLGVVGMGPIGCEVARLGAALRMRVVGVRRTPRGDEPCETWPLARLDALCAIADALVLALPLTAETQHLVDARRLALLPRGALFVNVGRGALVDEAALVAALASGHVGGAGLDVFEIEPLPPESPLWSMPNVIVTPHNSGDAPGNLHRATEIFLDNLTRWRRNEPLRNEVP